MEPTIIDSRQTGLGTYLKRVWQYRHLMYNLAKRDLKVKYSQTLLGILWALLQPLTGLLIFVLVIENLFGIYDGELPYSLFAFSGFIVWLFFSYIVGGAGTALSAEESLIKKVYFPRLILPLAKVLVGLVDFTVGLVLLIILMAVMGYFSGWPVVALPLFILLTIMTGLSVAIWLSALTIRYRDFHHIIPYVINFGIWLTPVFYPAKLVFDKFEDYTWAVYFNPMFGVVQGFRWSLLGTEPIAWPFVFSFAFMALLLVLGLLYFRRVERTIADLI